MPKKLNRPPLTGAPISLAAGVPVDPADEPLDSLSREWLEGIMALTTTAPGALNALPQTLPTTQGEASDVVDQLLRAAFGI
jgi:hypothetical protein